MSLMKKIMNFFFFFFLNSLFSGVALLCDRETNPPSVRCCSCQVFTPHPDANSTAWNLLGEQNSLPIDQKGEKFPFERFGFAFARIGIKDTLKFAQGWILVTCEEETRVEALSCEVELCL